jgi:hypothetical protein
MGRGLAGNLLEMGTEETDFTGIWIEVYRLDQCLSD